MSWYQQAQRLASSIQTQLAYGRTSASQTLPLASPSTHHRMQRSEEYFNPVRITAGGPSHQGIMASQETARQPSREEESQQSTLLLEASTTLVLAETQSPQPESEQQFWQDEPRREEESQPSTTRAQSPQPESEQQLWQGEPRWGEESQQSTPLPEASTTLAPAETRSPQPEPEQQTRQDEPRREEESLQSTPFPANVQEALRDCLASHLDIVQQVEHFILSRTVGCPNLRVATCTQAAQLKCRQAQARGQSDQSSASSSADAISLQEVKDKGKEGPPPPAGKGKGTPGKSSTNASAEGPEPSEGGSIVRSPESGKGKGKGTPGNSSTNASAEGPEPSEGGSIVRSPESGKGKGKGTPGNSSTNASAEGPEPSEGGSIVRSPESGKGKGKGTPGKSSTNASAEGAEPSEGGSIAKSSESGKGEGKGTPGNSSTNASAEGAEPSEGGSIVRSPESGKGKGKGTPGKSSTNASAEGPEPSEGGSIVRSPESGKGKGKGTPGKSSTNASAEGPELSEGGSIAKSPESGKGKGKGTPGNSSTNASAEGPEPSEGGSIAKSPESGKGKGKGTPGKSSTNASAEGPEPSEGGSMAKSPESGKGKGKGTPGKSSTNASAEGPEPSEGGSIVRSPESGKGKGKAKGPPTPGGKGPPPPSPGGKGPPPPSLGGKGGKGLPPPPPGGGKGVPPPSPGGKGLPGSAGKGPPGVKGPPPGKGKGAPGFGKSPATAKAKNPAAAPMAVGETPFGRRIHWVGAAYDEPDGESVFGAMDGVNGPWSKLRQSCGIETAPVYGIDFDPDLLKAMFSKKDQSKPNAGRQRQIARKPQGITVLDATRAQNMAIVISKLKVSCQDICRSLHDLDFFDQNVTIDDVELLIQVLPTPDESKKLLEHQHIVEQLRDVEQKMMHFCVLPKSVVRLRLMKFALSHATTYSSLLWRCKVLGYAAEEVHMSVQLKELLSVILRVGNFINYGVEQACTQGTVRAFAIESLGSLASFKTGAVSTLHFLCLSMRSADPTFFKAFKEGLVHVHEAARENVALLKSAIQAFDKEVEFAKLQGKMLLAKEEGPAQSAFDKEVEFAKLQGKMLLAKCSWQKSEGFADTTDSPEDRMNQLAALLQTGNSELQSKLAEVLVSCTEVQVYFSISEKAKANLSPFELFCGHISTFDEQLGAAWQEIERNPRRWQQFASAADSGNAARHKFASDARQQFASASRARRKSLPGGRLSEEQTEALRNNGDEEGRARAMTGGVGEGRAGAMTEEEITSRGHAPLLDVSQAPPRDSEQEKLREKDTVSVTFSESLEPAQGKRPPPKGSGKAVKGPPLLIGRSRPGVPMRAPAVVFYYSGRLRAYWLHLRANPITANACELIGWSRPVVPMRSPAVLIGFVPVCPCEPEGSPCDGQAAAASPGCGVS
ncbi:unnamed protein product, partial [Polarella glacialis]